MRRLFSKRILLSIAIGLGLMLLLAALRLADPPVVTALREMTFDTYQRFKPRAPGDFPVRIVDIDEASLRKIGQWPWPRTRIAELVDKLAGMGAAVIAFDILFAEPDRTSPATIAAEIVRAYPERGGELGPKIRALADHDDLLAAELRGKPVVFGFSLHPKGNSERPKPKAGFAFAGDDPTGLLPRFEGTITTLPKLQGPAAGLGSISLSQADSGGVVRRVPLLATDGKALYPSLALEALRVAQGASTIIVKTSTASGEFSGGSPAVVAIKVGNFVVDVTEFAELWVHYNADRPSRYVSAADVLEKPAAELKDRFEGQIVFVGTSASGLHDIRVTALGDRVPGVSIHAQAVEQILAGDFLSRPDWATGMEVLGTLLVGLLIALLVPFLGPFYSWIAGLVLAAAMVYGSWWAFDGRNLLVDPVYPVVAGILVFIATTVVQFITTEREKRFVRRAFQQYLAPELLHRLEGSPKSLVLGGETRELTILFMDVRDFTPISEQMTPEELVSFLNELLSPLSDVIQSHDGTIDKYIGDSIMAFWNAPLDIAEHPRKACQAALGMREIATRMNEEDRFGFRARGYAKTEVKIGSGLNTGTACVGNMGSERRFNYSVVGDAVNVAARIESSCKTVGWDILISEETREAVPDFACLEAGAIALKGKSKPAKLYALIGDEILAGSADFKQIAERHAVYLAALKAGDRTTVERLQQACEQGGLAGLDIFYRQMRARADAFRMAAEVVAG